MNKSIKIFFSIYMVFFCLDTVSLYADKKQKQNGDGNQKTGSIEVTINGINNTKGILKIGLANSKKQFDDAGTFYKGVNLKIKGKTVTHTFKDIPYGTYAVKVFHDENSNDKLDTNFFGVPTEQYGASNNARNTLSPPSYSDAKFTLKSDKAIQKITIK